MSKVLFDSMSWLHKSAKDHVDSYLDCTDRTRDEFKDEAELLEAVEEWLQENVECEWKDFLDECEGEEKHHCLVTGYFMSWMGPQEGGKVYKDLASAVSGIIMEGDSNPIFSIQDDGLLILDETHHDAPCNGNHYEFKILTKKGEEYYERHRDDDRRTLHEALKLHGRTRNVNIKIFGFNSLKEVKQYGREILTR